MPKFTIPETELLEAALSGLQQTLDDVNQKIAGLRRRLGVTGAEQESAGEDKPARRGMSAAARRRIALAQKRRWAEFRKKKAAPVRKPARSAVAEGAPAESGAA